MTVVLINENVTGLRVEIRWDGNNKSEAFAIDPGGFGALDIDYYRNIPAGAKCEIYAWKEGTNLVFKPEKTFYYLKKRGTEATYTFVNEQFTPMMQSRVLQAA